MSTLRFQMVGEAIRRKALDVKAPANHVSEYYGINVFSGDKMRKYLSSKVCEALEETMRDGKPLSREIADSVAAGMKQWAMDMGDTTRIGFSLSRAGRPRNTMPLSSTTAGEA